MSFDIEKYTQELAAIHGPGGILEQLEKAKFTADEKAQELQNEKKIIPPKKNKQLPITNEKAQEKICYVCPRCEFTTFSRSTFESHIVNRKYICVPEKGMDLYVIKLRNRINEMLETYRIIKDSGDKKLLLKSYRSLVRNQKIMDMFEYEFTKEEQITLNNAINDLKRYLDL